MKACGILVIYIFCFIPIVLASDIQISATIDRTTIALNQTFTYTIEISGEKANSINKDPKLEVIESINPV